MSLCLLCFDTIRYSIFVFVDLILICIRVGLFHSVQCSWILLRLYINIFHSSFFFYAIDIAKQAFRHMYGFRGRVWQRGLDNASVCVYVCVRVCVCVALELYSISSISHQLISISLDSLKKQINENNAELLRFKLMLSLAERSLAERFVLNYSKF